MLPALGAPAHRGVRRDAEAVLDRDHAPQGRAHNEHRRRSPITTAKRNNLILNVDGTIAVAFVDLMRDEEQRKK
jgi:hypothetical protein